LPTCYSWPDLNTGTDPDAFCLGFHNLSHNLVPEYTWIRDVPMTYFPHLDVGGAERASFDLDDGPSLRTHRIGIFLDRKATR
jgi:hypothetical protein